MDKPLFPVALDLRGRRCLVIGGTQHHEAAQKASLLEECGAKVVRLTDPRNITERALRDAFFVLSTLKDAELSARLRDLAQRYRFLLWCCDQPEFGFVSMMATTGAGDVRVGITTSGRAPSIAKALREGLQKSMDATFTRFTRQLAEMREHLHDRLPARAQARERVDFMREATSGFEVRITFRYPEWFNTPALTGCVNSVTVGSNDV